MNRVPLISSKKIAALLAIAVATPVVQAHSAEYLNEASSHQTGVVPRESARRQEQAREAMRILQEGRQSYREGLYAAALEQYRTAWDTIPKAPATAKQQQFIIDSISDASIAVAMEYAKVGRYDDAEQLLLDVLGRQPNNKRAKLELERLNDPIRNNPALTPEHVKNVEEVQRLLTLAYSYYDLAQYDEANKTFAQVIEIDPYNAAARRGQATVNERRSQYYRVAYDSYRTKALADVDASWEMRSDVVAPAVDFQTTQQANVPTEADIRSNEVLDALQISQVVFDDTPLDEALEMLRAEVRKQGFKLNFVYEPPISIPTAAAPVASSDDEEYDDEEGMEEAPAPAPVAQTVVEPRIRMINLTGVTGRTLLDLICSQTNCTYRVDGESVIINQKGTNQALDTRRFQVGSNFFSGSEDGESMDDDDFGSEGSRASSRIDAQAALDNDYGIKFTTPGTSASYSKSTGILTVTHTPDSLADIAEAVHAFIVSNSNKMYKVQAKFVEISQTNEEEIGFDWVINPFSVSESGDMYLGGVNGNNSAPSRTYNDFVTSGGSAFANNYNGNNGWPISSSGSTGADAISQGLVTGGLRSGTGATSGNVLNNLLEVGSTHGASAGSVAPGIMSLTGIFDSGSFQMIMRGLSQKKGVDVMSAPTLVARRGPLEFIPTPHESASDQDGDDGAAKIEVVRRFYYPISYAAPELQESSGSYGGSSSAPIATPSTPEEWAVEDVGITFRFKVAEDEQDPGVIKFDRFEIRVIDFDGFINYGSPITSAVTNETEIQNVVVTENRIDMPIFSRRYINSNPTIADGHTIALGGLIEDQVQKVEDRVPILGDLPLIGTLFTSNAESHVRKNLVIFVTAETITPSGAPIRQSEGTTAPAAGAAGTDLFPSDGLSL